MNTLTFLLSTVIELYTHGAIIARVDAVGPL